MMIKAGLGHCHDVKPQSPTTPALPRLT